MKFSRQHSIQALAWVLLAAFSLIYTEIQGQKADWMDLKTL
jgi:hypothetical protein